MREHIADDSTADLDARSPWHWVYIAGLAILFSGFPIYRGVSHIYHHRIGLGLCDLLSGLALLLLIGTWHYFFQPEHWSDGESLGERKKWFRAIPDENWTPPSWSELMKIAGGAFLLGTYIVLGSLGELLYVGHSGDQFVPYILCCITLPFGILVWCAVPYGVYRKIRWQSHPPKHHVSD